MITLFISVHGNCFIFNFVFRANDRMCQYAVIPTDPTNQPAIFSSIVESSVFIGDVTVRSR